MLVHVAKCFLPWHLTFLCEAVIPPSRSAECIPNSLVVLDLSYKSDNSAVRRPGAASGSIDSSIIIFCSDFLCILSSRILPSSSCQTAARVLTPHFISRLYMASLEDLKQNDCSSEPGMPVTSTGVLCADSYRYSVAETLQTIRFILELVVSLVGKTAQKRLIL